MNRKRLTTVTLSLIIFMALSVPLAADTYITTQVTDNDENDRHPAINARGHVAWYGSDGADKEIFIYDPATGTQTQITDNSNDDRHPEINGSGQIAWVGNDGAADEIFMQYWTTRTSPPGAPEAVSSMPQCLAKLVTVY